MIMKKEEVESLTAETKDVLKKKTPISKSRPFNYLQAL